MGSKFLLLLALVAAGILVFVVVTSMSDDPVGSGQDRVLRPDEGEEDIVAPPPLKDDAAAPEEMAVGETARLSVLVTDEENRPVPGAAIATNIDKVPAGARKAVTGPDGRAIIEGLPGGKKVSVRASGELTSIPGTKVVELEAGSTAEAVIVLMEGGAVTGTVLGPGGGPIGVPYRVEVLKAAGNRRPLPAGVSSRMAYPGRRQAGRDFKADDRIFTIGGLKPGTYVARGTAEGYIDAISEPFEIGKGSIRDGITITLDRGGRVSGVVVRGRTGEPVAGASVSLAPSSMITLGQAGMRLQRPRTRGIKTDEMGRFEILGVAPGDYTITAGAKELASGRVEHVKVEKGRDAEGVMVTLGEGGAISGTVFGPDGKPVAKARVQISRVNTGVQIFGDFGGNVTADENGVFHKDHLEPGRYRVKLSTRGVTASASVTIVMAGSTGGQQEEPKEKPLGPDEVMVYEGQVTKHDILSPQLCSITGTLTDRDGAPQQGRVRLEPLEVEEQPGEENGVSVRIPRFANVNAKGEFKFAGLLPGRYAVHAAGAREEVSLIPGTTAKVQIVVRPARVEGVVYGPDGQPAARARVFLRAVDAARNGIGLAGFGTGSSMTTTNDQGVFILTKVTAGRYRAFASLGRQSGESTEFGVGPDGTRQNLRIDLQDPTDVRVEVKDSAGNPVAGAMVMLRGGASSSPGARTNAEGIAALSAVPGSYTLSVFGGDGKRVEQDLVVGRSPQTVTVRLE